MRKGVSAPAGDGDQHGEAGCVADQDHAQRAAHGAAGVLRAHSAGEVSAAPQDRRSQGQQSIQMQQGAPTFPGRSMA